MFTIERQIQNQAGDVGIYVANSSDLLNERYDPGLSRPYFDKGQVWVDVNMGQQPRTKEGIIVTNAQGETIYDPIIEPQRVVDRVRHGLPCLDINNATVLPKEAWIKVDRVAALSVRARLRAWEDLRRSSTYGGFDGMATPILERELITDPGDAQVDMDGISEGRTFQALNALQGLPLPITHSGFFLSERFLAASRASGRPLDTQRVEMAGRRVGEVIERTLIGTVAGLTYGAAAAGSYLQTSKVYGYMTHPARITKTNLTTSATLNTNIATTGGTVFNNEIMQMIELLKAQNWFGPYMVYISPAYDQYLDADFKANSNLTIRQRVRQNEDVMDIRRLDYLTGDVILVVQMTSDVCQAINGQEVITIQYDTKGGMQKNFRVLGIQVPWIKSAFKSGTTTEVTGICHGTTS